ncbi:ribbon-helix-helix domain-containing protein [Natrinema salsiterrestre]|uniref:Ribbon-helix-helix domain-containing protein n=1 Tax=Natrinema salsiterrestre TaxID=2950540 RepID=A0A9Q4L3S9_9EURY|nr:ribbon-helix-helix domain-containing protein [Natrinema salsiterrestre]MDF9744806.1 ribbon-helix-helix domain-containing protein [Natrinema salsiterrestre]
MSRDRTSVPVSLPPELVTELDALVERGAFSSRSEALRHGAHLIVRKERRARLRELTDEQARDEVLERLDRKRTP